MVVCKPAYWRVLSDQSGRLFDEPSEHPMNGKMVMWSEFVEAEINRLPHSNNTEVAVSIYSQYLGQP